VCSKKLSYDTSIVSAKPECQTNPIYTKDNLNVVINQVGSGFTSISSASSYLEMEIFIKRGNLTSNQFVQIEPVPDPNDALTNIFPLISGTTNQYVNETQIVKINLATINNYPAGTNFKVMAEVEND
jgi:hypothetical protein